MPWVLETNRDVAESERAPRPCKPPRLQELSAVLGKPDRSAQRG